MDSIVATQKISHQVCFPPTPKRLRRGKQVIPTKASRQGKWRGFRKKGVDICWLPKCCFSARANRQKGEVDEGSFSAGAPCLLQLLPEIRSGSGEIAGLARLCWALLGPALLCGARPSWTRAQLPVCSNPMAAAHPREFRGGGNKKKGLFFSPDVLWRWVFSQTALPH